MRERERERERERARGREREGGSNYEAMETSNSYYLVLEFISGDSLLTHLSER